MRDGFIAHVLDLLGPWGGVTARRMFSGYGLYRQGAIFALVIREALYLRVDDRNRPDFAAAGSAPFRYSRGTRQVEIRGYMECPPDVMEDPDEMARWAAGALSAALAARAAKPLKRKRSRSKTRKITKV